MTSVDEKPDTWYRKLIWSWATQENLSLTRKRTFVLPGRAYRLDLFLQQPEQSREHAVYE